MADQTTSPTTTPGLLLPAAMAHAVPLWLLAILGIIAACSQSKTHLSIPLPIPAVLPASPAAGTAIGAATKTASYNAEEQAEPCCLRRPVKLQPTSLEYISPAATTVTPASVQPTQVAELPPVVVTVPVRVMAQPMPSAVDRPVSVAVVTPAPTPVATPASLGVRPPLRRPILFPRLWINAQTKPSEEK